MKYLRLGDVKFIYKKIELNYMKNDINNEVFNDNLTRNALRLY